MAEAPENKYSPEQVARFLDIVDVALLARVDKNGRPAASLVATDKDGKRRFYNRQIVEKKRGEAPVYGWEPGNEMQPRATEPEEVEVEA